MDELKEIYLTDTGRFNRLKYFKYLMLLAIFQIIVISIIETIFSDEYGYVTQTGETFSILILIALLVPTYFITAKREHDLGQNFLTTTLIILSLCQIYVMYDSDLFGGALSTITGLAYLILSAYLTFKRGDVGENQYGPDPLQ